MTISSGMCVTAKRDFMRGVHQPNDEYKVALYSPGANLNAFTETYTTDSEVRGAGYVAGGQTLSGYFCETSGKLAVLGWEDNPEWPNATIRARGAMIYNASKGGRALCVVDFGKDIISTNGPFVIPMPGKQATDALLWIG